jgi:hypothetical protein
MLLVCPRCSGSLQPDAKACPRCGLVLTNFSSPEAGNADAISPNGREPYRDLYPTPETVAQAGHVEQVEQSPLSGTAPYMPSEAPSYQVPVRPSSRPSASYEAPATSSVPSGSALLVPRGAVECCPTRAWSTSSGPST